MISMVCGLCKSEIGFISLENCPIFQLLVTLLKLCDMFYKPWLSFYFLLLNLSLNSFVDSSGHTR